MNKKAFTVFEIGLVITCAVVLTFIVSQFSVIMKSVNAVLTKNRLEKIDTAIQNHIKNYGYLPCPSDITIPYSDTDNFGKEVELTNSENCKTESGVFEHNGLFVGGVPVKKLKLQNEDAVDYWGNKIIYVVEEKLTKEYKDIETNLCVAFNNGDIYTKIDNVYYALISNGFNEVGAIPRNNSNNKNMDKLTDYKQDASNIYSISDFLSNISSCLNVKDSANVKLDDIIYYGIYNPDNSF